MKVVINDRTAELPPQLREYAERKLARLNRHFDRVMEAEIEFDYERRRSTEPERVVRIHVHPSTRKAPVLKAEAAGLDAIATIDLALDKIDRQVLKLKEKVKGKNKAKSRTAASPRPAGKTAEHEDEPERMTVRLHPETISEAERALDSNGHLFHVFQNEASGDVNVIYRRSDGKLVVIEPLVT